MHRWGAILMILGVNIVVVALGAALWRASFECALKAAGGTCEEGTLGVFTQLLTSAGGVVYWLAVIAGLLVFWRGKRMRAP